MKRGEIWTTASTGYSGKPRPAVIVQDKAVDAYDSIVVCLFTSHESEGLPFRVKVSPSESNGLDRESWVMVDKVAAAPKRSLGKYVGELESSCMEAVSSALSNLLGL